jgi:putative methionine-R-sulfoxide reductase with GAF domain
MATGAVLSASWSGRSNRRFEHLLPDAIALMARAADEGQETLFSEARILFRTALNAKDARILVRSAGTWRDWNRLDADDGLESGIARLAEQLQLNGAPVRSGSVVVAPVSGSSVAVAVDVEAETEVPLRELQSLCKVFHPALGSCESRHGNPDKLEAIKVFQRVANRILKSGDLNEVFTQITHEAKARLSADICGIMLKEGVWLVMQRCVGNLASETGSLRMRSGQGVGGRVVETRESCAIEDYVHSEVISRDFFDLARAERVKSALAVPLLSQNEVTGVLEVWRRRPSQFTPQHTAELTTLANLASLAIENVRLAQARESASRRLESTHMELQARYDVIRMSADLQEALSGLLLSGCALSEIAEQASKHLSRPVMILNRRLDVDACHHSSKWRDALDSRIGYVRVAMTRRAPSACRRENQVAGRRQPRGRRARSGGCKRVCRRVRSVPIMFRLSRGERFCSTSTTSRRSRSTISPVSATLSPAPIVDACHPYRRPRADTGDLHFRCRRMVSLLTGTPRRFINPSPGRPPVPWPKRWTSSAIRLVRRT